MRRGKKKDPLAGVAESEVTAPGAELISLVVGKTDEGENLGDVNEPEELPVRKGRLPSARLKAKASAAKARPVDRMELETAPEPGKVGEGKSLKKPGSRKTAQKGSKKITVKIDEGTENRSDTYEVKDRREPPAKRRRGPDPKKVVSSEDEKEAQVADFKKAVPRNERRKPQESSKDTNPVPRKKSGASTLNDADTVKSVPASKARNGKKALDNTAEVSADGAMEVESENPHRNRTFIGKASEASSEAVPTRKKPKRPRIRKAVEELSGGASSVCGDQEDDASAVNGKVKIAVEHCKS